MHQAHQVQFQFSSARHIRQESNVILISNEKNSYFLKIEISLSTCPSILGFVLFCSIRQFKYFFLFASEPISFKWMRGFINVNQFIQSFPNSKPVFFQQQTITGLTRWSIHESSLTIVPDLKMKYYTYLYFHFWTQNLFEPMRPFCEKKIKIFFKDTIYYQPSKCSLQVIVYLCKILLQVYQPW